MPFILKKFRTVKGKKLHQFLINDVGVTSSFAQKLIAKGRIFDENKRQIKTNEFLDCNFIEISLFEGQTKGLNPTFITSDFAIFDKPSGIMVHPISKNTQYTLLDEIRYHFGDEANLAHRIDLETSGLVLVSRHKKSDIILKNMFEKRDYKKEYLAIVEGKISKNLKIQTPIKKAIDSKIGVKMQISCNGKKSLTFIKPISYNPKNNQTFIKAIPKTGRQHQIRVHLHSIGHRIIGDPIYGMDENIADRYLTKRLSPQERIKFIGHSRLLLHSHSLEFRYKDKNYKILSDKSFFDRGALPNNNPNPAT